MTFELGPAILFCPADRPERFAKATERADAVILDLEDAVAPASKAAAREAMLAERLDPATTIVRINPLGSAEADADLAAVAASDYRRVMIAKCEDVTAIDGFDDDYEIIALCETAAGVLAARSIAEHPLVSALMWGAEDLVASLGGRSSRFADGGYRAVAVQARSLVLLAAGAAGAAAIDAVHLDIADAAGLASEAADAAASGFVATACIHPSQVPIVRSAYRPSETELAAAQELLQAADGAPGVFVHDGRMIDEPLLRHAREVIRRYAAE